jgi:hypothetical protein
MGLQSFREKWGEGQGEFRGNPAEWADYTNLTDYTRQNGGVRAKNEGACFAQRRKERKGRTQRKSNLASFAFFLRCKPNAR